MYNAKFSPENVKYFTTAMLYSNLLSKITKDNDWWVLAYSNYIGNEAQKHFGSSQYSISISQAL